MSVRRKSLKVLFVMDRIEDLDIRYDTSLSIMMGLTRAGHHIYYTEPRHLSLTKLGVIARAEKIWVDRHRFIHRESTLSIRINDVDACWIRKDPPFDLEYLYMTYLLERVSGRVLMINSPRGIRNANEKLFPFAFAKWMPPSVAASDHEKIIKFQDSIHSDLVLKPLNDKGGRGIVLLPIRSQMRKSIARRATLQGRRTILAQKFMKEVNKTGDKRILIWNGSIIGAFRKVPKRGEFRANLVLGAAAHRASVSPSERLMVRQMTPVFRREGLLFVGIDVIAGRVTEINVTSPAGITDYNLLNGRHLEDVIVGSLEKMCLRA